ncbi:transglutaminase domain-containing protein [Paenibacillus humicola]|uniref:transglutaminase domain-containing protein n=1 Tax=Paenibacillus humicola TaxID=3110540 RepID=UPI00237A40AA|nr:transglutaminase domain-containing protein [Paenibacillus humicola]
MTWVHALLKPEPVALLVLLVLLVSLIQGMTRGASGSAKRLFYFVWQAIAAVVSLVLAGKTAAWLSPLVHDWLTERHIAVPNEQLPAWKEAWYTIVTSLRDFELFRFGVLFLASYFLLRILLGWMLPFVMALFDLIAGGERSTGRGTFLSHTASRTTGALLGVLLGAGRAFIVIALLFVYVSLLPGGPFADSIKASAFYSKTASELIEPVAGDVLKRGPVLAEAVQAEFQRVLSRKYEVIDSAIPNDIAQAAVAVTKNAHTDKEKARALYDWIGSRIAYDWDKADNYEKHGEWKEQTPEDTFRTRKGVCIDIARLYAVMARASGLQVQVVTGLGEISDGTYGPHAWNEVRLADQGGVWIPLDATWAPSGDWFDPSGFDSTHVRQA